MFALSVLAVLDGRLFSLSCKHKVEDSSRFRCTSSDPFKAAMRSSIPDLATSWLVLTMLAAQACLEAADALTANGQTPGGQALYREVIVKYGFTPASGAARLQLQGLLRPKTGSRTGAS